MCILKLTHVFRLMQQYPLHLFPVCGDTLTVPTDGKITVTSPNYPDDYPDNMDCVWYISSESGNAILAEYQSFNLEECCDFYSAGNGAVPGEASSLIWQHSGTLLPADFTSTGPSIWMTMTSDASVSARGFRVILTDTG
ncbi:bone morphogenetic protein 1 homolog [Ptychodera flava]|uniref:bone morphogenetic protein 1 homolog n=1 Tax=Ptychodera flava TaxID=63121 RepID=UPI00396A1614